MPKDVAIKERILANGMTSIEPVISEHVRLGRVELGDPSYSRSIGPLAYFRILGVPDEIDIIGISQKWNQTVKWLPNGPYEIPWDMLGASTVFDGSGRECIKVLTAKDLEGRMATNESK